MSTPHALAIALCLAPALAMAQPAGIETAPPAETPAPAPAKKLPATLDPADGPQAPPAPRTPDEVAATFFDHLKADRVAEAYASLASQSAISDRGAAEKQKMTDSTQKALDAYGPVEGFELIADEKVGGHLSRRTYLLLCEKLPLRWKFYFYRNAAGWNLIDLRVDDALVETIDDATRGR
jgi:hypothetical protein